MYLHIITFITEDFFILWQQHTSVAWYVLDINENCCYKSDISVVYMEIAKKEIPLLKHLSQCGPGFQNDSPLCHFRSKISCKMKKIE